MKCVPVYHGIPAVLIRDEPWLHRHSENGALYCFIRPHPFHWMTIPLRSWRSRIFSKIIPNRRGSVDNDRVRELDASSTLPLQPNCADPDQTPHYVCLIRVSIVCFTLEFRYKIKMQPNNPYTGNGRVK